MELDLDPPLPRLGLGANRGQFSLLVLVNAFVGAMVGLERTVLPLLAEEEFGLRSHAAALSFIATFGLVKAGSNLVAGALGDRVGRRRVLVAGWLAAIPVPFLIILAPAWSWIVAANVLLGMNQGLAWSMTVVMKIDLVGPRRRGLAMGLNEFAGYVAVGLAALGSGLVAERFGLRPEPFYMGIAFVAIGLALTLLFVRETTEHVRAEVRSSGVPARPDPEGGPGIWTVFKRASWKEPALVQSSQAGLVNNLNDGLAWGLFPVLFASAGLGPGTIGLLVAAYPLTWGFVQLGTGALSDRRGRKPLIVAGMLLQAAALVGIARTEGFLAWLLLSLLLGLGTALVYPTLLAAIGDVAHPSWRGSAVGVYRLWRDSGYVVGALGSGLVADLFSVRAAVLAVGVVTLVSGLLVAIRMPETLSRS